MRVVLEIADSAMTYRSRYLNVFQLVPFVDLLLLDEYNPRSAAFQLAAIETHLRELPRITLAQRSDMPRTIAAEMRQLAADAQPAQLAFCRGGVRPGLIELTDTIYSDAGLLSDAIADAYFQHSRVAHRTGIGGDELMDYFVRHRTTYRYVQDVSQSWHIAHLALRETAVQAVHESAITFDQEAASRVRRPDYFGNPCEWFTFDQPHTHLEILAESRVAVDPAPERASRDSLTWDKVRANLEAPAEAEARDAVQYMFDSPLTAFKTDVASYARQSFPPARPLLAGAMELMHRIHADFRYDTTVTDAATPVDEVFEIRAGVCQDLAHVGLASMRSAGAGGALCLGLSPHPAAARPAAPGRRRCQPCLVLGLGAAVRLGRLGPHQRGDRGRRPCDGGVGPRLWRCRAGWRHYSGRQRPWHRCRGGCDPVA